MGDLVKFDDNNIDNVVTNLRRPQDIFHAEVSVHTQVEQKLQQQLLVLNNIAKVLHVPAILAHTRIDAQTKEHAPLALNALSVKKMKMTDIYSVIMKALDVL